MKFTVELNDDEDKIILRAGTDSFELDRDAATELWQLLEGGLIDLDEARARRETTDEWTNWDETAWEMGEGR